MDTIAARLWAKRALRHKFKVDAGTHEQARMHAGDDDCRNRPDLVKYGNDE